MNHRAFDGFFLIVARVRGMEHRPPGKVNPHVLGRDSLRLKPGPFAGPSPGNYHFDERMEDMTIEEIAKEALALPSEARALLADRLVESLDPAEDSYVRKLWAAEALRRRDDVRAGRVAAIPGEEALAIVRNAVGR